jgi:alpha-amylase
MKNICLYFQIHHPVHFRTFRFFEVGKSRTCYDDSRNEREIQEAVTNYYLPTNNFFLKLIHQTKEKFKLSYYISGTSFDQFLMYAPKIFRSFSQLADTGQVEFIGGTDSHSIVSLADKKDEFKRQIQLNKERIEYYFGQKPQVFVNTDLLYTNQIGEIVADSGYPAIITDGAKKILLWRSPNYLYSGVGKKKIRILFRNEEISNELSLLLNNPDYLEKPKLTERLFASLHAISPEEPLVNIYLNYSTLGGNELDIKQRFFQALISKIVKDQQFRFCFPSELAKQFHPFNEIGSDEPVCWTELFHSFWYPGNELQKEALKQLLKLERQVGISINQNFKIDWQNLQTSDHFYLMDENHPNYHKNDYSQSIYKSRYDAFINFMNILEDFRQRLKVEEPRQKSRKVINKLVASMAYD